MRQLICRWLSFVSLLIFPAAANAAGTYTLDLLPFFFGPPLDINSHGHVVGEKLENSIFHGILLQPFNYYYFGEEFPSQTDHVTSSINDQGQIAGYTGDFHFPWGSSNIDFRNRAFLWTPNVPNGSSGTIVDLGLLPGELEVAAAAFGVNSRGQVVGYGASIGAAERAFLWTPTTPNGSTGAMVSLGDLPGGSERSRALHINSVGQVVGRGETDTGQRAFLWTPTTPNGSTGTMIDLGDLPGGSDYSEAARINSHGQVVGFSQTATGNSAFLWNPTSPNATTGVMIDIGESLGALFSEARDINSHGHVVGRGHLNFTDGYRALIWMPNEPNGSTRTLFDLNTLLHDARDRNHWILDEATGIDDNGVIVGTGLFNERGFDSDPLFWQLRREAFMLAPIRPVPEPCVSAVAFAAVGILIGSRSWPTALRASFRKN